jgi:hypothetical protein
MESSEAEGKYQHALRARRPLTSPKNYTDANDIQKDEENMDDPDSAEAQARAHDYRAYNMPAILEGHEARIRAPERYRVPKALLAPRAATPPRAPTPPTASTSQGTSDPRVRGGIYRPEPPPRPVAPAARSRTPLFLPESREPSPSEPDESSRPFAPHPPFSHRPTSLAPSFSLHEHVYGKRPRSPSPESPGPKRLCRQLEETPRLRNQFLVDFADPPEPCNEQESDYEPPGKP